MLIFLAFPSYNIIGSYNDSVNALNSIFLIMETNGFLGASSLNSAKSEIRPISQNTIMYSQYIIRLLN